MNPDGRGHLGLLGTIFRYLPLFEADIKYCFIADSDNYNTIFLDKLLDKFFVESSSNIMTFRPIMYDRNNHLHKCVPNVFAGMMAIKKEKNIIYNLDIWKNMFVFMKKLYDKIFSEKKQDGCPPMTDKNTGKNPFEFGFEEQALSNVFVASVIKLGNVTNIPLVWLAPNSIKDYYLTHYELKNDVNIFTILIFN
jgi:hypothetical protein